MLRHAPSSASCHRRAAIRFWLTRHLDCRNKIERIRILAEDILAKTPHIALQIDSKQTIAQRKEIAETIADINMSMWNVEGYIRNIRKKFSDHLATIFPEPIE